MAGGLGRTPDLILLFQLLQLQLLIKARLPQIPQAAL